MAAEILLGRIYAQRQCARLEEAEKRAQLVIDHQRVTVAATRRSQQDRHVDERFVVDEVKKMLEQTGV